MLREREREAGERENVEKSEPRGCSGSSSREGLDCVQAPGCLRQAGLGSMLGDSGGVSAGGVALGGEVD